MKKIKIGLPCSPSHRIEYTELKVTEVLISYGGGMGGINKKYYGMDIINNNFKLITGEIIYINPNYIVTKRDVTIIKQIINTTGHTNYQGKICNESILTQLFLLDYNEDYEIINEYLHHKDGRIIYTDIVKN